MFKFKRKDKHADRSSSASALFSSRRSHPPAKDTTSTAHHHHQQHHQQRYKRNTTTMATMLSEDSPEAEDEAGDAFYQRGGTEVPATSASYLTTSSSSEDLYQYRLTSTHSHAHTHTQSSPQLRSSTATRAPQETRDLSAGALQVELQLLRDEMASTKREMMNEMHQTRYDLLKEVTMLKGTVLQLVTTLQQQQQQQQQQPMPMPMAATVATTNALSPDERDAIARRTSTVASQSTKDRLTMTSTGSGRGSGNNSSGSGNGWRGTSIDDGGLRRTTQLMPVDNSALSTPLLQPQVDELFPLVDCDEDVRALAQARDAGSREWVLTRVQDWLDSRLNVGQDTVLALVGDAGTGKSVAAAMICEHFHHHVVARHFCAFDGKAQSAPRRVLLSLVNQLAAPHHALGTAFKAQLARLNLKYVLDEADPLVLARKLLVDPLQALEEPLTSYCLVVDGLDQCTLPTDTSSVATASSTSSGRNELLTFLAALMEECPRWLGFVVTSKPCPALATHVPVSSVLHFSADNPLFLEDTVHLVDEMVAACGSTPQEQGQAREILRTKSGGNYAYLSFAHHALLGHKVDAAGHAIADADGSLSVDVLADLPESLYEIYEEIFEDKFGQGRSRLWRKARPVLELCVAAASGPYARLTEQHVMDGLGYSKDEVRMLRRVFRDILVVRTGTYQLACSAILDWLVDVDRRGEQFSVDATAAVQALRRVLRGDTLVASGGAAGVAGMTSVSSATSATASAVSASASVSGSKLARGHGSQSALSTTSSSSSSGNGSLLGHGASASVHSASTTQRSRSPPPTPTLFEPTLRPAHKQPAGILKNAKA